ncbi:pyridoxal phosphate-dependent aminotransferase [Oceanidesulfovibrio indonesiensis]|uniref:Aminotransferase n=1 Tax=Oceanidesulfovibrio indonesiensis TaxID=54767 RepID=A0A7M3MJW2_9BACT|nr:pyridoxal phosphate-dependent aminotransferase [Oceanidesulfovibrio indonesiensis]TVM19712.1 pyridoxal phosphate-dependent aminotransferase [Oceanidesulfovibrio indonesiensis]
MSVISQAVAEYLDKSSWIRKMFETGAALKAYHGEDAVCDFSLGNPDLSPPTCVSCTLDRLAKESNKSFAFGYMPNAGYPWLREKLADFLSKEQGAPLTAGDIVVTCGAAGGLNAIMRAVFDPGDELLCPSPYFVEYGFYAANHGGKLVSVPAVPPSFDLDVDAMAAAITPKTRIVLVNSPNNPTGAVYSEESLRALAEVVDAKAEEYGRPIFLVADEPYRFLTYDGAATPPFLPVSPNAIIVSSFSKNMSLAGERVGYIAVHPEMRDKSKFLDGVVLANRILGFVNAPAIGQHLVADGLGRAVDTTIYEKRRAAMAKVLEDAGIEFSMPKGGFYFFPKAPEHFEGDDVAFVNRLAEELVLAVPGRGFGCPGYFRLTFCVDEAVINRSAEGFKRAVAQ